MSKRVKFPHVPFLKMFKTKKTILTDSPRIIGWGNFNEIDKKSFNEYYNSSSFNLDYLESAKKFFESVHNDSMIRCYIPKDKCGPVVFVADFDSVSGKRPKPTFYAIAPRYDEEALQTTKEKERQP